MIWSEKHEIDINTVTYFKPLFRTTFLWERKKALSTTLKFTSALRNSWSKLTTKGRFFEINIKFLSINIPEILHEMVR